MKQYQDKKIAIVGSGLIGAGWTIHLLCHGVKDIVMYDPIPEALERAKGLVAQGLNFFVENGAITAQQKEEFEKVPRYTAEMVESVSQADFILENVPENLDLKRCVLAEIESFCAPRCRDYLQHLRHYD